jgi:hypothetical protein
MRRRVNSYAFLSLRGVSLRIVLSAQDAPLPVDMRVLGRVHSNAYRDVCRGCKGHLPKADRDTT